MNNASRPERAAVHLSSNHLSFPAREDFLFPLETIPRAADRISGLGKERTLGRRERRAAVCRLIHLRSLVINPSRPEHAAVYLSLNHKSTSARGDSSGGGKEWGNTRMSSDTSI